MFIVFNYQRPVGSRISLLIGNNELKNLSALLEP